MANLNERSLSGRVVLVTAGCTGTGRETVLELHRRGAYVIPTTRHYEHYRDNVVAAIGSEKRLMSLIFDITKPDEWRGELERLDKEGLRVTDVVHSAAAGMESFAVKLPRLLARLRKIPEDERLEAFTAARAEISGWVDKVYDETRLINYEGPVDFFRALNLQRDESGPVRFIFYSSFWSSFYPNVPCPSFYRGVAATKRMFEDWVESRADVMQANNVYPVIISGNMILEGILGQSFARYVYPLIPEKVRPSEEVTPRRADMVTSAVEVLTSDPTSWPWGRPLRRWVMGPGQILEEGQLTAAHDIFKVSLPI